MKGEDSDLISLKSIMSSPIITLPSSSTVRQAIQLMRVHKINICLLLIVQIMMKEKNYWYSNSTISCRNNSYSSY